MSEQRGKLVECDRCGCTVFLKYLGQGELDGGYTRWDKFEKLPETWMYESQVGCLCDKCAGLFRAFIHKLKNGEHIAPAWDLKPGDEKYLDRIIITTEE